MKTFSRWRGTFSAYFLATVLFLADQVSKLLIEIFVIEPGISFSVIPYFDFFRITYIHNPGAAWGILPGYNLLFVTVAVLVTVLCVVMIEKNPLDSVRYPWAMILGGGLGNMVDRIFKDSGVVDFLDVGVHAWRWPTFNIADSSLCVGMIWLIYVTVWIEPREENQEHDD